MLWLFLIFDKATSSSPVVTISLNGFIHSQCSFFLEIISFISTLRNHTGNLRHVFRGHVIVKIFLISSPFCSLPLFPQQSRSNPSHTCTAISLFCVCARLFFLGLLTLYLVLGRRMLAIPHTNLQVAWDYFIHLPTGYSAFCTSHVFSRYLLSCIS